MRLKLNINLHETFCMFANTAGHDYITSITLRVCFVLLEGFWRRDISLRVITH